MTAVKPKMLIAEDSDIAALLESKFSGEFDVVVAKTGAKACQAIDEAQAFAVCIIDIIMPVEEKSLNLSDADETGIRLIERILKQSKCRRFLILTVRWDLEETLAKVFQGKAAYRLLLKADAEPKDISEAIRDVLSE